MAEKADWGLGAPGGARLKNGETPHAKRKGDIQFAPSFGAVFGLRSQPGQIPRSVPSASVCTPVAPLGIPLLSLEFGAFLFLQSVVSHPARAFYTLYPWNDEDAEKRTLRRVLFASVLTRCDTMSVMQKPCLAVLVASLLVCPAFAQQTPTGNGYFGSGFTGGRWEGRVFRHNTVVSNVDVNRVPQYLRGPHGGSGGKGSESRVQP